MEIVFHSHTNKTYFHKKGCSPSLILKVRVFGTRKWPIKPLPPSNKGFTEGFRGQLAVCKKYINSKLILKATKR